MFRGGDFSRFRDDDDERETCLSRTGGTRSGWTDGQDSVLTSRLSPVSEAYFREIGAAATRLSAVVTVCGNFLYGYRYDLFEDTPGAIDIERLG